MQKWCVTQSKVEVTLESFTCRLLVSRFFTLLLVLAEAALRSRDRPSGAHLSAARAHLQGRASCPGDHVKNRKTRLRAWFGFPLTFALFARDRPATPPARPRKFCKKYRVPRGPRALLSETATPAILRTFRTSSVTLNQSHPIFRVFFCVHC